MRQELVQRWIQQADRNRQTVHGSEDAVEVFSLVRQQLSQCSTSILFGFRKDHFTHRHDAVFFEEHVLGSAQADALSTEVTCSL